MPGFPGVRGPRGQKGEPADTDDVQSQVAALENTLQALRAEFDNYKQVVLLQGLTAGQKTFISTHQHDTFTNGKARCAKAGGALACPMDADENAAVLALARRESKFAFLNMNYIPTQNHLVYENGEPVRYTNWKNSEPQKNGSRKDCVAVVPENAEWDNYSCDQRGLIICEF
uniref:Uncharacterized protein n=2 Tax=Sphaerodactylus townsendi TaxID=933632 RepID=A0ACB8F805_9SAUR